jgi:hypothetical protein
MIPADWSNETVFYVLIGTVCAFVLTGALALNVAHRHPSPIPPPIAGGSPGEIFKIRPTLQIPAT